MDIAKQIVDQRILGLIKENPGIFTESEEKNISKAFLMLGVSAYLDLDIPDTLQYITEGRNDGDPLPLHGSLFHNDGLLRLLCAVPCAEGH